MNNGGSNKNSSKNESSKPNEEKEPLSKQPSEETYPTTPPLSSSREPSRAYPSDPSRDYSSDPSKYAYSSKNGQREQKPKETAEGDRARGSEDSKLGNHQFQQEDYQRKYRKEEAGEERKGETNRREREWSKENFSDSSRYSKEQVMTYIGLALGFLIFFFNDVLGGFLIGAVAGYHFSGELLSHIRNLSHLFKGPNHLRSLTLVVLILALFIALPSLFIGAILVALFKQFLMGRND